MFTQIKMSVCRLVLIDIECLHHFLFNQGTRIPIDFYWYERIPMLFSIYAFVVRLVSIDIECVPICDGFIGKHTHIPIDFYWYERIPMLFSINVFVFRLVLIDKGHVHYVFKNKNVRSSIGLYRYRL